MNAENPRAVGPRVVTFGCRLNAFESEVLRERLGHAGAVAGGDVIIVNTCTVTAEAGRQARQAIRKARRENPGARIVVTGCAAQVDPEVFAAMPEVDRVVGNAAKLDPALLLDEEAPRVSVADVMAEPVAIPDAPLSGFGAGFEDRARAFVQIQQGCDHRCTFCIVPFARGPARSIPPAAVVLQARRLVAAGFNEIVLTGVDISSYGKDLPGAPSLGGLVRALLADAPDLRRLRLSSLDPAVMDEALFRALAEEERLMPHLHLSLQALDDMVLKRMKRRHDRARALALVARARAARPGVSFGADLIAGFPTETEAMFENTLAGVAEAGVSFLHVFPYSPRPGTPAAKMPPVPARLRTERAARLRRAGEAALARLLESKVGETAQVLVESGDRGRAPDHAPVNLAFAAPEGAVVAARLTRVADGALVGDHPAGAGETPRACP